MFRFYQCHQGLFLLLGVSLAFVLGITAPHFFHHLNVISDIFIHLLKLCALPIIVSSLMLTIGRLSNPRELKIIARHSIAYILLSEAIAVSIALILFNTFDVSSSIDPDTLFSDSLNKEVRDSGISLNHLFDFLFTDNIFDALVHFQVLPIVIFSIFLGLICAFHPKEAEPLLTLLVSVRYLFLRMLDTVMLLAPLAIFVLIGSHIAESYINGALMTHLWGLLTFVSLFFIALFCHLLWQTILLFYVYRHLSLKHIFVEVLPIMTTAFITSSSLATLPLAMEKAEALGGDKKVVEFMLPICASMNFASGMMYEMAATLFFLHILGIHPDLMQQMALAITCIVTGIAVGGIPETSMLSVVAVFNMAHIPLSAISILLPLDRVVDRIRTVVNILGNTCGSLIVTRTVRRQTHDRSKR